MNPTLVSTNPFPLGWAVEAGQKKEREMICFLNENGNRNLLEIVTVYPHLANNTVMKVRTRFLFTDANVRICKSNTRF